MRKDIFERMKLMQKEEVVPNYAEIARRYECDYRTVKKYFENKEITVCQRLPKPSKLDPYKATIEQKYRLGCNGKAIYYFIKKKGFCGSYTIVKRFCKLIKT